MNTNSFLRYITTNYPFRKGRHRLTSFAIKHIGGIALCQHGSGSKFLLDLDDRVDADLYLNNYDCSDIKLFSRHVSIRQCDIFIDIGAKFGLWTAYLVKSTKIDRIYAFEPDPRNFAQLMSTIFLNSLYNKVEAFNVALSNENGEAELYLGRMRHKNNMNKYFAGTSSLIFDESMHRKEITVKVAVQRLDDNFNIQNRRIAIKIDVEGSELSALKGAERALRTNDCVLCIELWGHDNKFQISDNYLRGLGYKYDGKIGDNYFYLKMDHV